MGNTITTHTFDDSVVRVVPDGRGEPWFVATDVAKILGYRDASNLLRRIPSEDKGTRPVSTLGGMQDLGVLSEPGLYLAIMGSRVPDAQRFKQWLASEVLPSIRKRGAYLTPEAAERALTDPDFIIRLATQVKEERAAKEAALAQLEASRPLTQLGAAVSATDDCVMVKAVADAITQGGVSVNQNQLFEWMRAHGWVCSRKGDMWNRPTKPALDAGRLRSVEKVITLPNGRDKVVWVTHVTGKGQAVLVDGFLSGRYSL